MILNIWKEHAEKRKENAQGLGWKHDLMSKEQEEMVAGWAKPGAWLANCDYF